MRTIDKLGADELDGLYQLYKTVCARLPITNPSLKDFHQWLTEEGYLDD